MTDLGLAVTLQAAGLALAVGTAMSADAYPVAMALAAGLWVGGVGLAVLAERGGDR